MSNRITAAIARTRQRLDSAALPAEKLERASAAATMDFELYCAAQDAKSAAFAGGRITLEEAQTLYRMLGSGPDSFNALPLAARCVVLKALMELLTPRAAAV